MDRLGYGHDEQDSKNAQDHSRWIFSDFHRFPPLFFILIMVGNKDMIHRVESLYTKKTRK
jgi:hypothetical protein